MSVNAWNGTDTLPLFDAEDSNSNDDQISRKFYEIKDTATLEPMNEQISTLTSLHNQLILDPSEKLTQKQVDVSITHRVELH